MTSIASTRRAHTRPPGRLLRRSLAPLALSVALILALGCGRKAPPAPQSPGPDMSGVTLPTWAPEEPSEAFLRTARVLKPLPEEVSRYSPLALASYELFGTLTDEQIATFQERKQIRRSLDSLSESTRSLYKDKYGAEEVGGELVYDSHEVVIPFPSLTAAQRDAFDGTIDAWKETFAGRPEAADLLVRLYEIGADKDLSNVEVAFRATGHAVSLSFQVRTERGLNALRANDFAQF